MLASTATENYILHSAVEQTVHSSCERLKYNIQDALTIPFECTRDILIKDSWGLHGLLQLLTWLRTRVGLLKFLGH